MLKRPLQTGLLSRLRVSPAQAILALGMGCANLPAGAQAAVPEPTATAAAPSIISFVGTPLAVASGQKATLKAVFANGSGLVSPGKLTVQSGQSFQVAPSASTAYTLKVTNSAGTTASKTVTVKVAPPAPVIASFSALPSTIAPGQSTSLTAVFSNGSASISPGKLTAVNGGAVTVSPAASTTYTLTVVNSAGVKKTLTTGVQVTNTKPSLPDLGVNIGWVTDWDPTQMFADAMKQARKFGSVLRPNDESASVDAQGWPTQDAGVLVIANNQGAWSAGHYALTFTGQAIVKATNDANVSVGPISYSSATNTSSATVTIGTSYQNVYLVFTQTQRTPLSPVGSGVTNVSLMRPSLTGAPLVLGTLFTDVFLKRLKYFSAIRMMDYLNVNSSTEQVWADRSIPAYASQQQVPPHSSLNTSLQYVTGASYEYAIQLANQSGKDLWLNVPHLAFGGTYAFSTTAWADNLALLVKYGSDANGKPYTGLAGSTGTNPQPNTGPVNPPLNPGLHVYLEYSNEFWSGVGSQSTWIVQQAKAAIAAQDPDLDWDRDPYTYDVVWRINAKGLMLIANSFANVYGASAFGSVYRPVFAGQIANSGTYAGLTYLDARYGGANQYAWAIAGAPYSDFIGDAYKNTKSTSQILSAMQTYQSSDIAPWIGDLAAVAAAEQLQGGMLAYEGGQGLIYPTTAALAAQTAHGMRGVIANQLDSWFAWGGGTYFYYKLCSSDMWGLSRNLGYDIDADPGYSPTPASSLETQPKWGAIKQILTIGH